MGHRVIRTGRTTGCHDRTAGVILLVKKGKKNYNHNAVIRI